MVNQSSLEYLRTFWLITFQIVDLMNMNKQDNTLYVVITYDIIEGKTEGMSEIKPLWLDVDQCGFSEARAKSQAGSYSVNSVPWKANIDGELIVMGGEFIAQRYLTIGTLLC
jgi:hypothetical protein